MITKTMIPANSQHLTLSFSPRDSQQAWKKAQIYTNDISRWNAYLNILCLSVLENYWQEENENYFSIPENNYLWEFVNGSKINFGDKNFIIIPEDNLDTAEFSIPQEWVDVPNLMGDYYLAVQILPDDSYLRIWGVISHNEIQISASYDSITRTYDLDRYYLTEEISILSVFKELNFSEEKLAKKLLTLTDNKIDQLINLLSESEIDLPRLEIDFYEWSYLLNNNNYLQKMYQKRLNKAQKIVKTSANQLTTKCIKLSNWLNAQVEAGWQTLDELLMQNKMAYTLRGSFYGDGLLRRNHSPNHQNITQLINQIYQSNEHQQKQAAKSLGEINFSTPEIIEALSFLINNTNNEENRWTAAESLWRIAPENHYGGIRRIKDLGLQIKGNSVALMVAILPKNQDVMAILLRVYPLGDRLRLPSNLQLTVLDENEKIFLSAKAREIDSYIQLKFSGKKEERFSVKLALDTAEISEDFVI